MTPESLNLCWEALHRIAEGEARNPQREAAEAIAHTKGPSRAFLVVVDDEGAPDGETLRVLTENVRVSMGDDIEITEL